MRRISSLEAARAYLRSFVDFEKRGFRRHFADVVNLETIRALLAALGDPQRTFPCVHLAGTKGKGSTAALLDAALRSAGYHTGLYTSPHLLSMTERVRLRGEPLADERMVELVARVAPHAEALRRRKDLNPPSFFEIHTALAFLAFAEAGVDLAVVETGLGGRLDATNVVAPLLTVVTRIGRDHADILGERLEQIAGEKAGIIKAGVPVVLGPQPPEADPVLRARAQVVGAPVREAPVLRAAGKPRPLPVPESGAPWERPSQEVLLPAAPRARRVRLPLMGAHQRENLGLAWEASRVLGEKGFPVSVEQFAAGVEALRWPARFEVVAARPWVVLDCAHNQPSLAALATTLPAALEYDRLVLVLGMSADKEVEGAVAEIAPAADVVVLTQAHVPRALWVSELTRRTWPLWRTTPHLAWTTSGALGRARALAGPRDCVCVTGSIFVVGEALQALGLRA